MRLPRPDSSGWRRGQGLIEYVVFLLLVAIVAVVAVALLGRQMQAAFQNFINTLEGP